MLGALGALVLAVLVGVAILWPSGGGPSVLVPYLPRDTVSAEVIEGEEFPCGGYEAGTCRRFGIRITSGEHEGEKGLLTQDVPRELGLDPQLSTGDKLRVVPPAEPVAEGTAPTYRFAGFDRRSSMLWLAIFFAALVVLFGRLRGAMSLLGLALSLVVVLVFIVPAILDGEPALAVAIIGSLAVMLVTILLAHGLNLKSIGALAGTTASLLLVAVLSLVYVGATHLTGFSSAEALNLSYQTGISVRGLLLAGMVIGALGVLDDITVSQASTVLALRRANPALHFRSLYNHASEVGRDHASAAVNTLVLAYVGAALPILLIFSASELSLYDVINLEVVAKEVVAMLVGSIGLIAAVPLTTALTAWLALRLDPGLIPAEEHGHAH